MTNPTIDPAAPAAGRTGRQPGDLYREVALYLASQPGVTLTVGEVTRAIGAPSSGAVVLALQRMAAAGYADHQPNPHRFTVTPAGIAAAGTIPPPAPRSRSHALGGRAAKSAPIIRPNGTPYFPRRLAGSTDVEVLRAFRAERVPVLLYGPPGTGKTSVAEAAFHDLITIAGHGDTTVEDFVGGYVPLPGGGYEYVYGPLVVAMLGGRPLFVDDATVISPKVLAVLYPAMDGRNQIVLTGYRNEVITAADGFYVMAGHNPGAHGAVLTDALASRFSVHIEVTTDWDLARHLNVPRKAVDACIAINALLRSGEISWAPQLREALAFTKIAGVLGTASAAANLAAIAPEHDRDIVIAELARVFGRGVAPLSLGKQR
jgi:MoxR-like ATPase